MVANSLSPRACAGCLGAGQCWICTGDGCHRCAASGRCHVCADADRVIGLIPPLIPPLVPPQSTGHDQVASAS